MFSFSQSGQDPALPRAGKCPSVSHSHPSRGCTSRPGCLQETRAASPRYKPSRYPAPRRMNPPPPPHHLLPLPDVAPVPARAQQRSPVGWRCRRWEGAGLIGSRQWRRSRGSSSSERSVVSVQKRQRISVFLPVPAVGYLSFNVCRMMMCRVWKSEGCFTNF